jgi:Nuclease-related domain
MHPPTLRSAELKSTAEGKVFDALAAQLDDAWDVFHSVGMVIRDPGTGASDDEADFVLVHPDDGVLVLEVKGGGIECRHGAWSRIVKGGGVEPMPDPFQQAVDHSWSLRRKIDEVDGWRAKDLFVVHALSFPDISVHELVLAPDAPPEIVLDRRSLADLQAAIGQALAFHRGARERRRPPGPDGVAMLRSLLAPQVRIEVPLATAYADEERQLVELTEEQAALLSRFGRDRRMDVIGCAGSGKTMLAVEQATRLAGQGR